MQVVGGSNPLAPTNRYKALRVSALRAFFVLGRFCPHVCPHATDSSRRNKAEFSAEEIRVGSLIVRGVKPRVYSNNGDTCRAIALDHGGIILQPSFMVADDIRSGRLIRVVPEYRSFELGIHAVYPTRKQLTSQVWCLVDFLLDAFATPAWESGHDLSATR